MYNLHSHSLLSDGALLPSEVAVRYCATGYKIIAITDHADYSNIHSAVSAILEFSRHWPESSGLKVLPGIELTHLPPQQFKPLAKYARSKGIKVIVAHGETLMEPVIQGTNRAALEADIDILAHPGLISRADAKFARQRGVFLELTSRQGHADTNRHVAESAQEVGAPLILNTDSHTPEDMITPEELEGIGSKAGLSAHQIEEVYRKVGKFLRKLA
jgi:histidinol phosphatase-like PHP family hydrolase